MVSFKANVTLPKEEYEKYKRGEIHSDKGLRGDDGRLRALPDIEEIEDGDKMSVNILVTMNPRFKSTRKEN